MTPRSCWLVKHLLAAGRRARRDRLVVDGSRFEDGDRYGARCVWLATIHGYPGILGNNGVIYPEGAEKAAHFIQLCNQSDVPLVFLQEHHRLHGGRDFEAGGIVKKGPR